MTEIVLDDSERTPCEIWSRVMGYYRPVSYWNGGKQSEWAERKPFREDLAMSYVNNTHYRRAKPEEEQQDQPPQMAFQQVNALTL